jgi:hypothetical protein
MSREKNVTNVGHALAAEWGALTRRASGGAKWFAGRTTSEGTAY